MPDGLELYDPTGGSILYFSTEMTHWFCRKTGTGTTTSATGMGNTVTSKAVVSLSGLGYTYPVIAIVMNGGYNAALASCLITGNFQWATDAPVGTGFTYYVFDWARNLPARFQGLETYDGSGNRTFSSEFWPMMALADLSVTGTSTFSGKSLAILNLTPSGHRTAGPIDYYSGWPHPVPVPIGDPYDSTGYQNDGKLYGGCITASGQTATYNAVSFDDVYEGPVSGDISVPPNWNLVSPVLAVDVTNIPGSTTFF